MTVITFSADVQLQAAPGSKPPRVTILAYSGGVMRVGGFGSVALDLAGMELSSIPLLADHKNELASTAGYGTPEVRAGELYVVGTLAAGTAAGEQVLALHRSGVRLQASVGVEPLSEQTVKAGRRVSVNERSIVAPAGGLSLVTKSKLREVSFVPLGADSQSSVSIAARKKNTGGTKMDSGFANFMHEMLPGSDPAEMTPAQLAGVYANYHGRTAATESDLASVAPLIQASLDPVDLEERRLRQINRACSGTWDGYEERVHALQAKAVAGELSVDDVIEELRAIRRQQTEDTLMACPPRPRFSLGARGGEEQQILEAALCLQGGLANPERQFPEPVLDAADRCRKEITLQQFLMRAACENDYRARPGERISDGNLRQVLSAVFAPSIRASGGFSTVSFPQRPLGRHQQTHPARLRGNGRRMAEHLRGEAGQGLQGSQFCSTVGRPGF